MTIYYVLAIAFVLFAITLTAIGLTRDDFPARPSVGRAVIVAAGVIATVTFAVLVTSTHVEHPREEAAAEAAEKKAESGREQAQGEAAGGAAPAGKPVEVIEKEFTIEFKQTAFKGGKQEFDVDNQGKLQHDLAVEGGGKEAKTPLLDAGEKASLEVDLAPGKYKLYCTVPGHEELGMKKEVTVD